MPQPGAVALLLYVRTEQVTCIMLVFRTCGGLEGVGVGSITLSRCGYTTPVAFLVPNSDCSVGVSAWGMPLGTVSPHARGQGSLEKQPDFPQWGYKLLCNGLLSITLLSGWVWGSGSNPLPWAASKTAPAADQAVGVLAAGSLLVPPEADPSLPESCQQGWHRVVVPAWAEPCPVGFKAPF